jgi:RNA polymerase sigma-70 factor (ECF subfamily)
MNMSAILEAPAAGDTASALSDAELVTRIRAGELALFELLMRRFNRRLFLIARSILLSNDEAEDAVQEAYVRGWRRLNEFRGPDGLGAWFARIVTNEALMMLRKRNGKDMMDLAEVSETLIDHATAPEHEAETMQLRTLLEHAIDRLPQPFRTTYVLREVEQLSVAETAACLDIDPATVKTRIHRARKLLRRHLSQVLSDGVTEAYPFAGTRCDRIVGCDRIVARVMAQIATEAGSRYGR